MLQAFVIVAREGLEAFLIVAITLAYLRKTKQERLVSAAYVGIGLSVLVSAVFGFLLLRVPNQALWEGVLGVAAVVMVASLVIHMWRVGPKFKRNMELQLQQIASSRAPRRMYWGVLLFTVLMISREGMETALLLIQVKSPQIWSGALLGAATAGVISYLWAQIGHRVNLGRFFQVTGLFLLLFMAQIAVYSFHELCEASLFPNSEYWHIVTEPFSAEGMYGKWFSLLTLMACGAWLMILYAKDVRSRQNGRRDGNHEEVKDARTVAHLADISEKIGVTTHGL